MTTRDRHDEVDVVIVGAGPAGLSCAASLAAHTDLKVVIVDAGHAAGGQFWRQAAGGSTDPRLHHDLATFARLRATIDDSHHVSTLHQHHVWAVVPGGSAYLVHAVDRGDRPGEERSVRLRTRAVVLATGAFDRSLPFPGWDLPGVMTIGGVQSLLKASGVSAGRRVLLGGTGPFLLPVATGLITHGATVVGIHEANSPSAWLRHAATVGHNPAKLREGAEYAASLARHRVPVRTRSMIVCAEGGDRVESVTTARLDASGRLRPDTETTVAVDAVGIGWGFTPQLDLALTLQCATALDAGGTTVVTVDDVQRTSRPRVFAAGEPCGVAGAAVAVAEGELAAVGVAQDLLGRATPSKTLLRRRRRLRRFATAMHLAHPVPEGWAEPLEDTTVVCRCEEISCVSVRRAISDDGADSVRQVKQLTRAGMGWCQGRVCGFAAGLMCGEGADAITERLAAAPVPLGALNDGISLSNM